MKANIFLIVIAVLLSALLGYFAYYIAEGAANDILCGIGSTLCFAAALIPAMGLQYESGRFGVNVRLIAVLFFVLFLISQFCFAACGVRMPYYLIVNGIFLLVYLAVLYKMLRVGDVFNTSEKKAQRPAGAE